MSGTEPATPSPPPPPYAHWVLRVGSALVDDTLLLVLPLIGFGVVNGLGLIDANGDPTALGVLIFAPACLLTVAFGVWNRILREGATGQSLGHQVTGIRLVDMGTLRPIGAGKAFVRRLAHLVDGLPCACLPVGYLWPLFDPKRQTFADKIMGTIVVRLDR